MYNNSMLPASGIGQQSGWWSFSGCFLPGTRMPLSVVIHRLLFNFLQLWQLNLLPCK